MFKKGNAFEEQERGGWIYGYFMPDSLAKDSRLEIKIVKLDNKFTSKPHSNKTATKIDIVFGGSAVWEVDGEEIEMKAGDYLIIPPNVVTAVKKVISDELVVQRIRVPSSPNDKVSV